jgi:hypothetical protein
MQTGEVRPHQAHGIHWIDLVHHLLACPNLTVAQSFSLKQVPVTRKFLPTPAPAQSPPPLLSSTPETIAHRIVFLSAAAGIYVETH